MSIADEIRELAERKQAGHLTEAEFSNQKARLLGLAPTNSPSSPKPDRASRMRAEEERWAALAASGESGRVRTEPKRKADFSGGKGCIFLVGIFLALLWIFASIGGGGDGNDSALERRCKSSHLLWPFSPLERRIDMETCKKLAAQDPSFVPWYRKCYRSDPKRHLLGCK